MYEAHASNLKIVKQVLQYLTVTVLREDLCSKDVGVGCLYLRER